MTIISAYPANDGLVLANGVPVAGVSLVRETELCSEHPVTGFGDDSPSSVLLFGRGFEVGIERERALGDDARLETLDNFTLTVEGRAYTGCRIIKLEKTKKADGPERVFMTVRALGREEAVGSE